jgi:nitric oxide reductase NorD protein
MDAMVRDLYLLAEAVAVDWQLAADLPGLMADLVAGRAAALAERPAARLLSVREGEVERRLRAVLAAAPAQPPREVPLTGTPEASLAWAASEAEHIHRMPGRYRGVPAVALWGRVAPPPPDAGSVRATAADDPTRPVASDRVHTLPRRPRVRVAPDDEDDGSMGMWMIQLDDPQEHAEDPMGLQRPTDRDDRADPGDLADSLSELPEARLVAAPGSPAEVLASDDPPDHQPMVREGRGRGVGVAYPEWDYRIGAYHEARAVVRESPPAPGDAAWAPAILRCQGQEVRQVRRRFERLRPQRIRLGRQPDGADVDLTAYVTCHADVRAGCAPDDRLYESVRPTRRDISICLLVDVSGSTDSWVGDRRRIVDVEKEALLLVCEALDALGDRYGVLAFSGEGPEAVTLYPVKEFGERNGPTVQRRIAGLEPDRYTRAGAAIRHATAALARETARHRLLLILSDGKPNDVDLYEGRYGIEDTRQAVAEARLQGLHPFCLTVDRQAPAYIARIFGAGSYAVLRHPSTLPRVLVDVVRRLVRT